MNSKVGKVAWGSPELKTNTGSEEVKKIPFLNMAGYGKSWKVRVISEQPERYYCHFTTDKSGKTIKINCTLNNDCPVHIEKTKTPCGGVQADSRFYLKVLDRTDTTIKVLDVGKQIINGIGELMANEDWGHCNGYDITISKGERGTMPLYTVAPSPHNELAAEEIELASNSENLEHEDFIDLNSRIQPLSVEVVNKILGLAEVTKPKTSTASTASTTSTDEEFDDIDWGDE